MTKERKSCTLCIHFDMESGTPACKERPKVHEIENFPFKDTDCESYHYVFDFSHLYNRKPRTKPKE